VSTKPGKVQDSVNKEADDGLKEMRQGIDGLGKSLEQLMSPNGASSAAGAVAGASMRSSI
jgi:hypothetical protein